MRAILTAGPVLLAAASASAASAEPTLDLFAGRGWAERTPLTLTADEAQVNGQAVPATLRVDIDSVKPTRSGVYGARLGYWFGRHFGLALDAATLDPDLRGETVSATADLAFDQDVFGERVTIDAGRSVAVTIPRISVPTTATIAVVATARLPIAATPERPQGRAAPYAFAGPAYLITSGDLSGDFGLRAGGGVKLQIGRSVGLFGEYRYTRVNAEARAGQVAGTRMGNDATTGDIFADVKLRHHAVVGGVSFGF